MTEPDTLLAHLARRARESPGATAFTFRDRAWSFEELWTAIRRFATGLAARALGSGTRVILLLPNGEDFFAAFYGIEMAGGIPVPLFPGSGADRVLSIAANCGARAVVAADVDEPLRAAAAARGIVVLRVADAAGGAPTASPAAVGPDDIAFVQYTSGSTGAPKGVPLTHRKLLTNIHQMIDAMRIVPHDVFVSWLPAHHDMGLILMTMCPFVIGADLVLLPTDVRDTGHWLAAIERFRGTFTAAPEFAYRLCLRQARGSGRHDLGTLRVALNAAEPVRARTIAEFESTFDLEHVVTPAYGLAEATVGVSTWSPGRPVLVDSRGAVSVGSPFRGVEVLAIREEEPLPAGDVGELVVRSPTNCSGYLDDPEASARLFWRDGWVRTGDLGYLDRDGNLFVLGRSKNVIKRFGETIAPREIEEIVDPLPGVRYSAAVGIDSGRAEGEQVFVFVEVRDSDSTRAADLVRAAVRAIHDQLGFRPARVHLVEPHSIPLTANGKLRHAALGEEYVTGRLRTRILGADR